MKKAIKQKLMNLVSINASDPIIQTNLGTKQIDILKIIPKEDLQLFLENELTVIEFNLFKYIKDVENKLKATQNINEFMMVLSNYGWNLTDFRKQTLENNFSEHKIKTISSVVDQINAFVKKMLTLNKLAKSYYDDTNVSPLYIATKFLEGRTKSFNYFKSPLVLYRVSVKLEGTKLIISKLQDDMILNEKLLVYLKKEYNDLKTNISDLLSVNNYKGIIETIQTITDNTTIENKNGDNLVSYKVQDWNNPQIDSNSFQIENSVVLGIYEPDGGLLKEDLKYMVDNEIDPFENKDDKDKPNEFYIDKVIKEQPILELSKPLNIYQKYAIASSLNQNTLIYGPPGTGKSEIIANLVFNILLKGKSTLLVSEKKVALEVVTERINSLAKFAIFIYDLKNKDAFYEKIDQLNQLLGPQWYREKSKGSKFAKLDPIKFTQEESMFIKNYQDWYQELAEILKHHWNVEDFQDGIYKYDYADYERIKNELGPQITKEWLNVIDDETKKTLYQEVQDVVKMYNFIKIEDLFEAYLNYTKFLKKFGLRDKYTQNELYSYLEKTIKKIHSNVDIVENYLSNQKKITNYINSYKEFLSKYDNGNQELDELFFTKSTKDKKIFIEKASSFMEFYDNVIAKDFSLNNKNPKELRKIAELFQKMYDKYGVILNKSNLYEFLIEQKEKLIEFVGVYKTLSSEDKKAYFAEFIDSGSLLPTQDLQEHCTLNLKQIAQLNKDVDLTISLINFFIDNQTYLAKNRLNEIVKQIDFIGVDLNFLKDLMSIKDAYSNEIQDIYKEWSWLSNPYIKTLYLDDIVLFDLTKVEKTMKKISTFVTTEQFKQLKVVLFWEKIIKLNPIFSETKNRFLQDIIVQLRKESYRSAEIVEEITFKKYIQNLRVYLSKLSQEEKDEIATVFKLASAKSNLPSPVKFIKHFYSALKKLFPIWVGRPDNVATVIPLNQAEFDYGIFDEASQLSIERAYPLVYRCDKKIVAGDDKQLKPTSFFVSKIDNSDYDIDDFDSAESLLERAKTAWWNEYHLKNHYRSWSKSLMEFSNKYIYNNNLEIATKSDYLQSAIDVINVNGLWNSENLDEAKKVVELLKENWDKYKKILIVTFNSKQSVLIENLLSEQHSKLEVGLKEKLETSDITITNLENVQGNEGDLVILSVAYGKNSEGYVRNNFGPLIAHGGMNRLNVAITRAKQKMIIVKSLYGSDIKVSNQDNENAVIFKKFIEYADDVAQQISIDEELTNLEQSAIVEFNSELIKEIYGQLMMKLSSKYQILLDLNIGTKNIDIAIINRENKEIVKAIIIEPWKENRSYQLMIEDIDRQYFLEERGYSTFRVKEYEWYTDKHKLIQKIVQSLDKKHAPKVDYVLWQQNNK
ncbi:MAG: DUF4011 domain-containing protein [Ureaplasma sp.]|nr:DUF4011 domain-containing protein [Ureaplasma sp.]